MNGLNVGCGKDIIPGFVNLDITNGTGVNIIHDLSETPRGKTSWHLDELK